MEKSFPIILSALRRERNISQRKAAAELNISQALLSHYENGAREPGLSFVCRACDYYDVSADFILGRSKAEKIYDKPDAAEEILDSLQRFVDRNRQKLSHNSTEEDKT